MSKARYIDTETSSNNVIVIHDARSDRYTIKMYGRAIESHIFENTMRDLYTCLREMFEPVEAKEGVKKP